MSTLRFVWQLLSELVFVRSTLWRLVPARVGQCQRCRCAHHVARCARLASEYSFCGCGDCQCQKCRIAASRVTRFA